MGGVTPPFFMDKKDILEIERKLKGNQLDEARLLTTQSKLPEADKCAVMASIELKANNIQEAEVLFHKALSADPKNLLAIGNLAQLYVTRKKFKEAKPYAEAAYKNNSKNLNFALNYIACLADHDQFELAIDVLKPFVEANKVDVSQSITYASLLRASMRSSEALLFLEKLKEHYPNEPEVERAIADVYAELDPLEARRAFKEAIKVSAKKIQLSWNWSFVELRLRNFKQGWELYENGLTDAIGKIGRPLPPQVKGMSIITDLAQIDKDKYTLFVVEQGIGDQVLFLGCFEEVLRQYPKSILITEDRTQEIFQRSFPQIEVYGFGAAQLLENNQDMINGIFPIGSLQKFYRSSVEKYIENQRAYIRPNEKLVEKFRSIYSQAFPGKKLIGISWQGGFWDRQKKTKSFDYDYFRSFFNKDEYAFIPLQYGDLTKERELSKLNKDPIKFIQGVDFKKNIDAWVAMACACDQILSVSTALVHFAGAAGKRVDVLLSEHQAPFIWGLEEGSALPYPDVHVWRKSKDQSIEEYFSRMKEILL